MFDKSPRKLEPHPSRVAPTDSGRTREVFRLIEPEVSRHYVVGGSRAVLVYRSGAVITGSGVDVLPCASTSASTSLRSNAQSKGTPSLASSVRWGP